MNYKWKQFGWSIVSVGILSCGAGYRSRSPGYLSITGPNKVRLEQPDIPLTQYKLPPLDLGDGSKPDPGASSETSTVQTNHIPAMREKHYSVNSLPTVIPPQQPLVIQQNNILPRSYDQLAQEFLPPGFLDILDDPIEREDVGLKDLLPIFKDETNRLRDDFYSSGPRPSRNTETNASSNPTPPDATP